MRICYWGTYERGYIRNHVLIEGLRRCGVEVEECHAELWKDAATYKWKYVAGIGGRLFLLLRLVWAYVTLTMRYLFAVGAHDAVCVGHYGHLDMLVIAPLARLRGKPIVYDAHLSLYDTMVNDRAIFPARSWKARLCWFLDVASCRLADRVLLAEAGTIDFFAGELGVPREKMVRVFIGADDAVYMPGDEPGSDEPFVVVHWGKYIPLHGMEVILHAAKTLEGQPIQFRLIGEGQLYPSIRALAESLALRNVEFIGWVLPEQLRVLIAESHVCLGIFGTTAKAGRVIPNKIYEGLCMAKPIVTADTPAARELLTHGKTAYLVPAGDVCALAAAITALRDDPGLRRTLGRAGRDLFIDVCAPDVLGREVADCVRSVLKPRRRKETAT